MRLFFIVLIAINLHVGYLGSQTKSIINQVMIPFGETKNTSGAAR